MLWRGVDITTFPTPTLWGWVDGLKEEIKTIRAEIDRRAVEAAEGSMDETPVDPRGFPLPTEGTEPPYSIFIRPEDQEDPPTEGTELTGVDPELREAFERSGDLPTDPGAPPPGTEDGG